MASVLVAHCCQIPLNSAPPVVLGSALGLRRLGTNQTGRKEETRIRWGGGTPSVRSSGDGGIEKEPKAMEI